MTANELIIDEVAARIYRATCMVRDEALRELIKNAAVSLLSADSQVKLRRALKLTDGLLGLAVARGALDEAVASALRTVTTEVPDVSGAALQ